MLASLRIAEVGDLRVVCGFYRRFATWLWELCAPLSQVSALRRQPAAAMFSSPEEGPRSINDRSFPTARLAAAMLYLCPDSSKPELELSLRVHPPSSTRSLALGLPTKTSEAGMLCLCRSSSRWVSYLRLEALFLTCPHASSHRLVRFMSHLTKFPCFTQRTTD